ncbi:hypothetical protein [Gracilibacillus sp. JCM 18860]|uniref:hypothetical protein n=1 Tax=Gracilibacillus sp. JCM 18860 TaxID=1306159 RepID=UPI0006D266C1
MKLILNNDEKIVELNSLRSVDEVIEKINNLLNNKLILSHLVIDGKDLYNDIEQYLDRYLATITTVQIIAKSKKEFINDTLDSAEKYINQAIIL